MWLVNWHRDCNSSKWKHDMALSCSGCCEWGPVVSDVVHLTSISNSLRITNLVLIFRIMALLHKNVKPMQQIEETCFFCVRWEHCGHYDICCSSRQNRQKKNIQSRGSDFCAADWGAVWSLLTVAFLFDVSLGGERQISFLQSHRVWIHRRCWTGLTVVLVASGRLCFLNFQWPLYYSVCIILTANFEMQRKKVPDHHICTVNLCLCVRDDWGEREMSLLHMLP